ncbi:MAG: hypothetical protein DRN15_09745 [Thermoprotei archaeon]|nr:MAG: hypothetical protein DRN15_09745 [Thermoprotei archaeon]
MNSHPISSIEYDVQKKRVTFNKIYRYLTSKLDREKAFIAAMILLAFKYLSSFKAKFLILVAIISLVICTVLVESEIFMILAIVFILLFLFDYILIQIMQILNPHKAALLRGLKLSNILGGCGFPVFIYKGVIIRDPAKVYIGDNVALYENVVLIPGRGIISIGDNSHIDSLTVIHGSGDVIIGSKVAIASGVIIYSHSNQYAEGRKPIIEQPVVYKRVIIEDDVWIGSGAIILPGAKVRKGAIIGAGALITSDKELDEYTIYVGVPAKPFKKR